MGSRRLCGLPPLNTPCSRVIRVLQQFMLTLRVFIQHKRLLLASVCPSLHAFCSDISPFPLIMSAVSSFCSSFLCFFLSITFIVSLLFLFSFRFSPAAFSRHPASPSSLCHTPSVLHSFCHSLLHTEPWHTSPLFSSAFVFFLPASIHPSTLSSTHSRFVDVLPGAG